MSDSNAQEAAGAPDQAAEQDAPMAYIDQLAAAAGASVEDTEQDDDDDEEWAMDTGDEDNEDDDNERYMYGGGESEPVRIDVDALRRRDREGPATAAAGTVPDEEPVGLSERARTQLTWRLDKAESFSDWTIEIRVEDDDAESNTNDDAPGPQLYHVHKATLATGPRKSEYWNGIFTSGQFQESGESLSRISFQREVAASFPDFLDYMYAPYSEADRVLKTENVMQLKHLAGYFIVQPLGDAADAFIKKDMRHLDRLEKYLTHAIEYEFTDLVSHAVGICANSIDLIKDNDPLLFAMPPAFLLAVFQSLRSVCDRQIDPETLPDNVRRRMFSLLLSYIRHHDEQGYLFSERYLEVISIAVGSPPTSDMTSTYDNALYFLQMTKDKSLSYTNLEHWCIWILVQFLTNEFGGSLTDRERCVQIDLICESTPIRVSKFIMKVAFKLLHIRER